MTSQDALYLIFGLFLFNNCYLPLKMLLIFLRIRPLNLQGLAKIPKHYYFYLTMAETTRQQTSSVRKLAAIMFTDIVGYTALMGKDEQKALALLHKNREIQKHFVEKNNGRWLKEMGDGTLLSFNAITDAIHCANEIQIASKDVPELKLRIGIHLEKPVILTTQYRSKLTRLYRRIVTTPFRSILTT